MRYLITIVLLSTSVLSIVQAQAPAARKPDSPEVIALVEKAKMLAGAEWAETANQLCAAPGTAPAAPPPANLPFGSAVANRPVIEPIKLFDNLYMLGRDASNVYALITSDGPMLIETGLAPDIETVVIPGLKKIGIDPATIKMAVISHGHGDKFGGSAHLQEKYGVKLYLSAKDWGLVEGPYGHAGGYVRGPYGTIKFPIPKHDMELVDGRPVTLGDVKITPISLPGHTAGAMGFFIPVKDEGKTRMAAMYGGWGGAGDFLPDNGYIYKDALTRFKATVRKMNAEIWLKDQPVLDGQEARLEKLKTRQKGQPNPFVVGTAALERLMDVHLACVESQLTRAKQAIQ